jgi:hypothetical protein
MTVSKPTMFSRIGLPVKVGLAFALVAMLLVVVGIVRGAVPANPLSILMALLISGGSWGLVSWAVTTAVLDVESDLAQRTTDSLSDARETEREMTNGGG